MTGKIIINVRNAIDIVAESAVTVGNRAVIAYSYTLAVELKNTLGVNIRIHSLGITVSDIERTVMLKSEPAHSVVGGGIHRDISAIKCTRSGLCQ